MQLCAKLKIDLTTMQVQMNKYHDEVSVIASEFNACKAGK